MDNTPILLKYEIYNGGKKSNCNPKTWVTRDQTQIKECEFKLVDLRGTAQGIHVGPGSPWPTLLDWVVTGAQYVKQWKWGISNSEYRPSIQCTEVHTHIFSY